MQLLLPVVTQILHPWLLLPLLTLMACQLYHLPASHPILTLLLLLLLLLRVWVWVRGRCLHHPHHLLLLLLQLLPGYQSPLPLLLLTHLVAYPLHPTETLSVHLSLCELEQSHHGHYCQQQ
jgi:hypothetical protein